MNKKSKIVILGTTLAFIAIFAITYKIVVNQKSSKSYSEPSASRDVAKELKEDLMIALYSSGKVEKIMNIDTFKEAYNVDKKITEDIVTETLTKDGYILAEKTDTVFKYEKQKVQEKTIKKYTIGEKDGYLAIYKNENEKMSIIREYETSLDMIRLTPQEMEKIKNKIYFSSDKLEDVEEEMTGLSS